jgi:effector-binding domain-containing protein
LNFNGILQSESMLNANILCRESMQATPQIIQTEELLTAVIHLTLPRTEIASVMGLAISEIMAAVNAQGLGLAGPCFSYHWKRPSETFDFEVGFPVSGPVTPTGRVKMSKLPATKVARTIYQGSYEGIGAAWGEFCDWVETEGLDAEESLWEIYLSGPESSPDPATWRTELNRPLAS